jgi:hypothetical protein
MCHRGWVQSSDVSVNETHYVVNQEVVRWDGKYWRQLYSDWDIVWTGSGHTRFQKVKEQMTFLQLVVTLKHTIHTLDGFPW